MNKKLKPPLWVVGGALALDDGSDAGARMDAMAAKVQKAGGVPAAGRCRVPRAVREPAGGRSAGRERCR